MFRDYEIIITCVVIAGATIFHLMEYRTEKKIDQKIKKHEQEQHEKE